jgi:maltose alpha-D-glucosyltransferase/alpha-amylase
LPLPQTAQSAYLVVLRVEYLRSDPETYVLPLSSAPEEQVNRLLEQAPQGAIARLQSDEDNSYSLLYDALYNPDFCVALLQVLASDSQLDVRDGGLAWTTDVPQGFEDLPPADTSLKPTLLQTEQSNTLIAYGDRWMLKLFRRLGEGINPELEIGRFLTEPRRFMHTPPVVGTLEYHQRGRRGQPITLAVLQGYVSHQEDAWHYTRAALTAYFDKALAIQTEVGDACLTAPALLDLLAKPVPPLAQKLIGPYLRFVRRLGRRTAELHLALASELEDARFAPEPFSVLYQHSLYQSMRGLTVRVCRRLGTELRSLPTSVHAEAQALLERQEALLQRLQAVLERPLPGLRIRCHGNYHLRQVLCTGKDVVLIDFEGEPVRLLWERQLKRSPLLDVASMLRSFHYAAYTTFFDGMDSQGTAAATDLARLESWTRFWCGWVSAVFLNSYLKLTTQMALFPQTHEALRVLCDIYLLEKAIYELGYELEHRPDQIRIPLRGLHQLLGPTE